MAFVMSAHCVFFFFTFGKIEVERLGVLVSFKLSGCMLYV